MFESGSYDVDEVSPNEMYLAKHVQSDEREQWCKVSFEVKLVDDYYACECGMFEHMGMRRHVAKVLLHMREREIPVKHIMKRWKVDARNVLPPQLKHYQKDQDNVKCFS